MNFSEIGVKLKFLDIAGNLKIFIGNMLKSIYLCMDISFGYFLGLLGYWILDNGNWILDIGLGCIRDRTFLSVSRAYMI